MRRHAALDHRLLVQDTTNVVHLLVNNTVSLLTCELNQDGEYHGVLVPSDELMNAGTSYLTCVACAARST